MALFCIQRTLKEVLLLHAFSRIEVSLIQEMDRKFCTRAVALYGPRQLVHECSLQELDIAQRVRRPGIHSISH